MPDVILLSILVGHTCNPLESEISSKRYYTMKHCNTNLDVVYQVAAVYVPLVLRKFSLLICSLPHNWEVNMSTP
jgi:hypothetical protein